jgi:ElaB/YqjD/DUF883 family membrane-anchored ribosome-binding protein
MSSKNTNVSEDIERIKADVAKLRSDLSSTTKKLVEIGKEETGEAKEKAKMEAAMLLNELHSAFEESKKNGKRSIKKVENKVVDRPFLSLLFAFMGGLIFCKVLDNNKTE